MTGSQGHRRQRPTAPPSPQPPGEPQPQEPEQSQGQRCPVTALYGPHMGGDDMPALYEDLRARYGPVAPVAIAEGVEVWLVLGHRELLHLTRSEQDFSHDPRHWNRLREGRIPADSPLLPFVGWRPALLFADGVQHRRMRAAVSAALAAVNGHELRRTARALAERLIDSFAADDEADLVGQYARALPMQVIAVLLGFSPDTGRRFAAASAQTVQSTRDSADGSRRLAGILGAHVADKRSRPGDDITSALLRHPARLSDEEVMHNLIVMFVAGNQTTANWIATTLRILLCDPAFRSSVTRGHLSIDDALDLVLWRWPPTQNFPARYATRDLEFGGRQVRAGDMLILGLAAANADPAVRAGAEPITGNRSHLAFGAGPHACPAQDPARLITRSAIDTLRHRLPDVELAVPEADLAWISSPWTKGLATLPVRINTPAPSAASAGAHPGPGPSDHLLGAQPR